MSLFSWKPEYSVNEAELDSHHQTLFAILNDVYESVMNSSELESIIPRIDELSANALKHFSVEERYMLEHGFPEISEHIAEHRKFAQKLDTLRSRRHEDNLDITRELIVVLGEWLLHHVLREDRKYSELSTATGDRTEDIRSFS